MKSTKLFIISAFVLGLASAFTTKNIRPNLASVKQAVAGTSLPCTTTTFTCGTNGGICQNAAQTETYYPATASTCTSPLQQP